MAERPEFAGAMGVERLMIMSILLSRIATGKEISDLEVETLQEDGDFDVDTTQEMWPVVNKYFEEMAGLDPERAFEGAVAMCLLPESPDHKKELVNRWMRTSGLTLLGEDEVGGERLANYFVQGEHGAELRRFIYQHIFCDITDFDEGSKFVNPQGFSTLQAIYVATRLEKGDPFIREGLSVMAEYRLIDPDVQVAARIAMPWKGCEQFADLVLE